MKVKEAIEKLKQMPQDVEIYFDCQWCGKANISTTPVICVLLTEKVK